MKTIILSFVGVLVLIGGTIGVKAIQGHTDQQVSPATVNDINSDENVAMISDSTDEFPEVTDQSIQADLDKYNVKVVTDNNERRVLLFMDDNDQPVYKSILVKGKNLHKLINLQSGQVDEVILGEKLDTINSSDQQEGENKDYQELTQIGEEIELDTYTMKTLEDNEQKRILLFEDTKGHAAYKSIFIKKKNRVELINVAGKGKTTISLP